MNSSWNIVGHEWAVDYLRRSVARGDVAHAYLLSGPAGIGKATLALRLAQALLCERNDGDPCLVCRSCKRIASGNHPDVRAISLATQAARQKPDEAKSRELRIDTIREWQRDIDLRPFEAARRVFILDDADKLNEQAANAMLKTLEEPPPYAVLILIAQGAGDLLPTIVSRCRVLRMRPVARAEIASALEEHYRFATSDAGLLAAWSGGRTGWAFTAAEDPVVVEAQQAELDAFAGLRSAGRVARLKWAEERAKEYRADQFAVLRSLQLWQSWWRDVLLVGNGCSDAITYRDRVEELSAVASNVPLAAVYDFLRHLDRIREQLADNVNPQLALENLVLHLP
jgi:DNA polymerase III subunit delta'